LAERDTILAEFEAIDPGITISLVACPVPDLVMSVEDFSTFINCLYAVPNGVAYMSATFPGQTETSNNLATVRVASGQIHIGCLTRSSVESRKLDLVEHLRAVFELAGYATETAGDYPGWKPNPKSRILALAQSRYQELFQSNPRILAGHGGLECGIIGAHYPDMDMISIGPTILGAHSPDERASVMSSQKFWRQLKDILEHIA
jgi:dipeptidase D